MDTTMSTKQQIINVMNDPVEDLYDKYDHVTAIAQDTEYDSLCFDLLSARWSSTSHLEELRRMFYNICRSALNIWKDMTLEDTLSVIDEESQNGKKYNVLVKYEDEHDNHNYIILFHDDELFETLTLNDVNEYLSQHEFQNIRYTLQERNTNFLQLLKHHRVPISGSTQYANLFYQYRDDGHMYIFNDRGDMVSPDLFDFNRQIDYTNESWLENVLSCNLSTLRYDTDH